MRTTSKTLRSWCAGVALGLALGGVSSSTYAQEKVAIFAGGCFWCVESDFDQVPGVIRTISGYTGGHTDNPTYRKITGGGTGHREAVQIVYDATKVSYRALVDIFWRSVDPTDAGGQFCDRGHSYSTAIFVANADERAIAEATKDAIESDKLLSAPIVTTIEDASTFFPAEKYHQDYYEKNPVRYKFYRYSCGRNATVKKVWGTEAYAGLPAND
ncbi:MAG: peptide-methionine (S)-S-oxide reductase MsrA [Pseudomonadota bacterium]